MTSIIKVQNIQYTDGDAALTIADGGGVTAASNLAVTGTSTLSNTLNVSHGTTGTNVATFVNSTANSNSSGVVHVKQTGATNQPTMVLEQTGEGGNAGDKQGLHIKNAGQNQGDGQVIAVTTTNSNLNSGNAFDCFRVWGNGAMSLLNAPNTLFDVTSAGVLSAPKQPMFMGKNFTAGVNTSGTTGYSSSHNHYKPTTVIHNNGNHFDNTNGIFTAPVAGYYFMNCTFSRTSDNWVAVAAVKNTTTQYILWMQVSSRTAATWDTRDIICIVEAAANDKLYFTYANGYTAPGNNNETMMTIFKIA